MWERLEAFWDGDRTLLIGIFDGDSAPFSPAREIAVFSSPKSDRVGSALLDIIPTDQGPRYWLVNIPAGHRHVAIQSTLDKNAPSDLQLSLAPPAEIRSGSWHLLVAGVPPASTSDLTFHVIERRAASANPEQFWERQIAESHGRAVAGLLQHRSVQSEGGNRRMQLAPSRVVWPRRDSRIIVEPVARPPQNRRERYRNMNPEFSILALWLQEAPPPVVLRVSPGEVGGTTDRLLGQTAVVHVMHQRRHLNKWRQKAKEEGDPTVDLLTVADMHEALGGLGEEAPVVAGTEPIVAFNLFQVISTAQQGPYEIDGLRVRQVSAPSSVAKSVEIEFPGATLGDEVGLVSSWANPGQLVARPRDPGGMPQARLFRVGDNELLPLQLDVNDAQLDDVIQLAGDHEISVPAKPAAESANAEQLSAGAQVAGSFRTRLGNAAAADFIDAAKGHGWDAIVTAAYVGAATAHGQRSIEAAQQAGGHDTFLDDSAIVGAVTRNPNLIEDSPFATLTGRRSVVGHLARRFAALLGMPELVEDDLTEAAQIQAWRVLSVPGVARKLAATRIRLAGPADVMLRADLIADALLDLPLLKKMILSLRDRADAQKADELAERADELAEYVRKRQTEWTALPDADSLLQTVNDVNAYWREFETVIEGPTSATNSAASDDSRSPVDLLEAVRALLARARELRPAPEGLAGLEAGFRTKADRFVLRNLEARLLDLVDAPAENEQLEKVVETIETWAGLPNFARRMAPRLTRGENPAQGLRKIVTAYVDRTARWMPRRLRQGGNLDRCREEMVRAIDERLAPTRASGADREQIAPVVARYGEILLLHQAYKVIDEIVDELRGRDEVSHELHRLKIHLGTWPAQAANTWEEALVLAQRHFPAHAQQLSSRISPPTFDAAA